MAIEDLRELQSVTPPPPRETKPWGLYFVLALLVIGQVYTLYTMTTLRSSLEAEQAQTRKELNAKLEEQFSERLSAFEQSSSKRLEALKNSLDQASKRVGSQGGELRQARDLVAELQATQQQQASELKSEIARKADQEQLGALHQDVTATRTDLESTKKTMGDIANNLGMTRSNLGTLIARNHDDIEYLRKLGDRDYFEFSLEKGQAQRVAGIGLTLKKANVKRHRYTLALLVDDMQVEKKDRTINEPMFFYVAGSRKPYELVVNSVESDRVKGYLSTPKGAAQAPARSDASR
jgi:hypothetical protein